MQKISVNKFATKLLPFLLLLIATMPAISAIIRPGFFPMHDDLQAMRQLQMDKCFSDFQIPCRWVPDMGYGFGYPLFNYYPPFPYYLGELIHLLGISILDTIKILFILVFLVSAITMYFLAKEFWGKLGGLVSALFYVWAPYHAVDVYVRGAMNEAWAISFFPAILWSLYKLIVTKKWFFAIPTAFFSALLALSHMPTLMVFAPGALVWVIFWFWQEKSTKSLVKLTVSGLWALGLAAFFILPLLFELKYVHSETLFIGYFNYLAHFLNLNQLFISRYWGYGESINGPLDTMALPLGHLHWFATIVALLIAWLIRKEKPKTSLAIIFFFFWTYFYTFLTHQRASLIWRLIPQLANLQFPWRILALSMIGTSFLSGSIFLVFKKTQTKLRYITALIIIIILIALNFKFFTWREFYPDLTDEKKFSGKLWELQKTSGIFDYLPKQIPLPPPDPPDGNAKFITGKGQYITEKKTTNFQSYNVKIESEKAVFQINTFYFPGWNVSIDNNQTAIDPYRDKVNGTMIVDLAKGNHKVTAKFQNTQLRTISDIISLLSWFGFVIFIIACRKPWPLRSRMNAKKRLHISERS